MNPRPRRSPRSHHPRDHPYVGRDALPYAPTPPRPYARPTVPAYARLCSRPRSRTPASLAARPFLGRHAPGLHAVALRAEELRAAGLRALERCAPAAARRRALPVGGRCPHAVAPCRECCAS